MEAEIDKHPLANTPEFVKARLLLAELIALAGGMPTSTRLYQNYPNPFNPETWVPYQLASDATVQIAIYDIKGSLVRRLNLGHQQAGYYHDRGKAAYWDGRNEAGEPVSSGVYFYTFTAGTFTATKKFILLK